MTSLPDHPFHVSQLAALDLTRAQLRALVADGVVRPVLRGVYCRHDLEDTTKLRAQAAALVLPPSSVVCDRSAAWLWGVDCFEYAEHTFPPALEVVAIEGRDRSRRRELLAGKRDLREDEICEIDGIRVTTPLRTAIDLACLRGRMSAQAVLDGFSRAHDLRPEDYLRMLERFRGRRGVKQPREIAPYAVATAESLAESWTRRTIIDAGLPAPTPQVWVLLPGIGWVRLDMAYESLRVAVEYDGEEHHTSDADRARDEARREALRRAGWIVIVVRKGDLSGTTSEPWLRELRDAVTERAPHYRRRFSRGESSPRRRRRR